jgi:hypothetical protein
MLGDFVKDARRFDVIVAQLVTPDAGSQR